MDFIQRLRLVRDVGHQAKRHGYSGDVLTDEDRVPLVGTWSQQMAIATIGCDTSPGPMSTRDRQFLNRLCRAAVLTSARPKERTTKSAGRRAW
jgi:hypothetical protein